MSVKLKINGTVHDLDVEDDAPLLWVIRDEVGLTGTKFGCGIAQCGACTVHVDGVAQRTCMLPVSAVAGKSVTTIEGLSPDRRHPTPSDVEIDAAITNICRCGTYQRIRAAIHAAASA